MPVCCKKHLSDLKLKQFVDFASSPLGTQWLLRLHCLLLWLEAEVLNINTKAIIKPFQEAVRQCVFLFVWGGGEKTAQCSVIFYHIYSSLLTNGCLILTKGTPLQKVSKRQGRSRRSPLLLTAGWRVGGALGLCKGESSRLRGDQQTETTSQCRRH